jgi:uncharacterized membrane protein YbhN (UPF0104 family)
VIARIRGGAAANRRFLLVVRLVVAVALLGGLFASVGVQPVVDAFSRLAWWWIPVLLSLRIVAIFIQSQRWRLFLVTHRIRASNSRLFKSYWISRFFNNFLPGQLGGDIYRVLWGLDPDVSRAQVASTVVVERIAGLIGLLSVAAIGGGAGLQLMRTSGLELVPIVASVAAVVLLTIAFTPAAANCVAGLARAMPMSRAGDVLARLASDLLVHVGQHTTFLKGILLSAGFYGIVAFESFVAFHALGVDVDLASVLVIAPIIALIVTLPISVGGWGTAEAASVLLYTQVGVSGADALSLALLARANFILMCGMGGLLYLWQSRQVSSKAQPA